MGAGQSRGLGLSKRRQDGGVPSQSPARSPDWESRLPGGGNKVASLPVKALREALTGKAAFQAAASPDTRHVGGDDCYRT